MIWLVAPHMRAANTYLRDRGLHIDHRNVLVLTAQSNLKVRGRRWQEGDEVVFYYMDGWPPGRAASINLHEIIRNMKIAQVPTPFPDRWDEFRSIYVER